jgi:hypothetical protein
MGTKGTANEFWLGGTVPKINPSKEVSQEANSDKATDSPPAT